MRSRYCPSPPLAAGVTTNIVPSADCWRYEFGSAAGESLMVPRGTPCERPRVAGSPPAGRRPAPSRTPNGSRSEGRPSAHLQVRAQLLRRAVDASLGPRRAQAEHGADLVQRQVKVEVQKQCQAILSGQVGKGASDIDALGVGLGA